jgi:glucose-1-phosphate adenylyltransferase
MNVESTLADTTTGIHRALVHHSPPPLALILADDQHADLDGLTAQCSKSMLPFVGKYRLIDFALSNCIHSGIETVGVISQYRSRSLIEHLAHGGIDWYTGTADAIYQNRDFVLDNRTDETLILFGSVVHNVDLEALTAQHRETGADLTIAVAAVDRRQPGQYNTLAVDLDGGARGLVRSGSDAPDLWAVIGVLLFSTDALSRRLNEDAQRFDSAHDLVGDVVPAMIKAGDRVMTLQHTGYWSKLASAHDYWQASMDLLDENCPLASQNGTWPLHTQAQVRPPTHISTGARVAQSLICEGCVIEGTVEHSVLSPGVHVAPGAVVRRAVVMHDASIEECAWVENAILDIDVVVGPQARVGNARRRAPTLNLLPPEILTVLKGGVHAPAGGVIESSALSRDWFLAARSRSSLRAQVN